MVDEALGGCFTAGQLDGEDGAGAAGKVALGQREIGAAGQRGLIYPGDLGAALQELRHPGGILHMPLYPQRERLEPLQK